MEKYIYLKVTMVEIMKTGHAPQKVLLTVNQVKLNKKKKA
jgi:hypothetical protein